MLIEYVLVFVAIAILGVLKLLGVLPTASEMGLKVRKPFAGIFSITLVTIVFFALVYILGKVVNYPSFITDKDNIFALIPLIAFQEIMFRSILLTYLNKKLSVPVSVGVGALIFSVFHLAFPGAWILAVLTIFAGIAWGAHFLRYRNIYLLILSHLIVNLCFNFLIQ